MLGYMPGHDASQPFFEYLPPQRPQSQASLPTTMPGYTPSHAAGPSFEYFPPHPSQFNHIAPSAGPPSSSYSPPHPSRENYMIPSALPILPALGQFKYPSASLEGMPSEIKLEIMHALHDLPSLRLLKLASREYYMTARTHVRSLTAAYRGKFHPDKAWPRLGGVFFQGQSALPLRSQRLLTHETSH